MEDIYVSSNYPRPLYEPEREIPLERQKAEANSIFNKEGLKALGINLPSKKTANSSKPEDPQKKEMLDRLNNIKRHPLIKY
jgi:hypothetical protein